MALLTTEKVQAAGRGDYRRTSTERRAGLALVVFGMMLAAVTLIANVVAGNLVADGQSASSILPWSFGVTTLAFGTIKLGIAAVLVGILVRLYMRIDAVKEALPKLLAGVDGDRRTPNGTYQSPQGRAIATTDPPRQLPIHTLAQRMWGPMLVTGAMALLGGLFVSFNWNATGTTTALAWTQGLQFLGEGFLLTGISFLLGSILAAIRNGGGEVQSSLGVTVRTLAMPNTAKVFVGLMMLGLMAAIAQFVLYVVLASNGTLDAAALAWLSPLRELSLGLLLSGIVLALATIATALGFQFDRIRQLITTGR